MERVTLPPFKIVDPSMKEIGAKMEKVKLSELVSKVYELGPSGGHPTKSVFRTSQSLPLRPAERKRLALTMNTEEIMNTNQYYEDEVCQSLLATLL